MPAQGVSKIGQTYIQTVAKSGNAVVRWLREYDFPRDVWKDEVLSRHLMRYKPARR